MKKDLKMSMVKGLIMEYDKEIGYFCIIQQFKIFGIMTNNIISAHTIFLGIS